MHYFYWQLIMLNCIQLLFSSHIAPPSNPSPFVFMTVDAERTATRTYDYIIVGGGTVGYLLVAMLSTKYSVLVIERGGSPYGDTDIENADSYGNILYQ